MVNFRNNKNQFLEYIARIGNNLPQMIACSISEVVFDYATAKKFNKASKKNKHIEHFCISNSIFTKGFLFQKNPLNLVLDGILSMGFDYISLPDCQLKDCLNSDTIKYLSQEQVKTISMPGSALSSLDVDIISRGILSNEKITSIDLSNCAMYDAGLISLSNAICKNPTLKSLNLSSSLAFSYNILANNFGQMSVDYFFNIMQNQESITNLNFSGNKIANIEKLVELMQINKTIVKLNLSCCGISETDNLFQAMRNQSSIKSLNFSGNKITNMDKLLEILQTNTIIMDLDLYGCNISNFDINRILQVLVSNNTIVYLELDGNDEFNDASGKTLLEILKKNHTLKYLGLATHNDTLSEKYIEDILSEMEKRENFELNLNPYIDGHYRKSHIIHKLW